MPHEELIAVLDSYLADVIERVVRRYRYDVDLDEEYEDLLQYILRRLIKAWFNGRTPHPHELEKALRQARRKKSHLEVLVSYLVSRYVARRGKIYVERRDWEERI